MRLIVGKKKEGPRCHYTLSVTNNSDDSIYVATNSFVLDSGDSTCLLYATNKLPPKQTLFDEELYDCWEDRLTHVGPMVYYIVHKDSLNTNDRTHSRFYACDSIYYYNKVLKTILVTKETAQQNKFHFYYP